MIIINIIVFEIAFTINIFSKGTIVFRKQKLVTFSCILMYFSVYPFWVCQPNHRVVIIESTIISSCAIFIFVSYFLFEMFAHIISFVIA